MKKLFCAVIAVFLAACNFAVAEIDLSSMTYEALISLDISIRQEISSRAAMNDPENEESQLLYEDENISIEFSNMWVEEGYSKPYIYIEALLKNKTTQVIDVVCEAIIVDGCTVDISKFVEVPPNAIVIHEWMDDAEQYLKYKIEKPDTISMMLSYDTADGLVHFRNLMSEVISIQQQ